MRRVVIGLTATVGSLILLFSYRTSTMGPLEADAGTTGAGSTRATTATRAAGAPTTTSPAAAGATGGGRGSTTTTTAASGAGATTYDGTAVRTRYGNVQVRITVSGDRIADVAALQVPSSTGRDQAINSRAVPVLRQQALAAQSADIAGVSGATYTSDGYQQSLQSALDAWRG